MLVALPVVILNSPAVSDFSRGGDNPSFGTARDIVGILLWALGFIVESWADIAKVSLISLATVVVSRVGADSYVSTGSNSIVLVQEQEPAQEPTLYRSSLGLVSSPALFRGDHPSVGYLDLDQ